jgi:hypothetical protein
MCDKRRLDVGGEDIDAARDDHVLLAANHIELTVVVKAADITGAHERLPSARFQGEE